MVHWIFLILAILFAALACDAYRLRRRATQVPTALILKDLGHKLDHLPLAALEPAERALQMPGLRASPGAHGLFFLLALFFAIAAVVAFVLPA